LVGVGGPAENGTVLLAGTSAVDLLGGARALAEMERVNMVEEALEVAMALAHSDAEEAAATGSEILVATLVGTCKSRIHGICTFDSWRRHH